MTLYSILGIERRMLSVLVWLCIISVWNIVAMQLPIDTNYTQVSLLPFQISIEFTAITAPDVVDYAITEYLLNRTIAVSIDIQRQEESKQEMMVVNATSLSEILYFGTSQVSTNYGSISEKILQREQRIALLDPSLETQLQYYYDQAIYPYESSLYVRGINFTVLPKVLDPTNDMDDIVAESPSYGLPWYTVTLIIASVVAFCVVVLILITIGIASYQKYWHDQLQFWKYNVDRENHIVSSTDDEGNSIVIVEEQGHHQGQQQNVAITQTMAPSSDNNEACGQDYKTTYTYNK